MKDRLYTWWAGVALGTAAFLLGLATLLRLDWPGTGGAGPAWPRWSRAGLVALVLGLAVFRLVGGMAARPAPGAAYAGRGNTAPPAPALWRRPWMPWALISLALLMFVAVAFALLGVVHYAQVPNELSLPVLAIAGVIALLGSLALVSVSLSLVNMGDKTQALGLPQGSVRAVIALSLVVLFAILAVYLFGSLNGPQYFDPVAPCVTQQDADDMLANQHSVGAPMFYRTGIGCPRDTKDSPRYDVYLQRTPSPAGIDFAKQLLVLIGTLVTSVASFYFGARAVGEARDAGAGLNVAPVVLGAEPATLPPGGVSQSLDLLGRGLNGVRQVQLSRGAEQVHAISVTSNDSRVHAKLNVPATVEPGPPAWDVTVADGQGRSFRLPSAVTIGPAPKPQDGLVPASPQTAQAHPQTDP